jgi:hypothetical protein
MDKDQIILEKLYMEITNIIQGNFGTDPYKRKALEIFSKYGNVFEGEDVESEDASIIGMIYDVAGDDWEYFEDLEGNVIITRFVSEEPDTNIIRGEFGGDDGFEFDLNDALNNQDENNVTLTPKEFVEYISNVL